MILEYDINRSISNNEYIEKISAKRNHSYLTSKLKIVQNQVNFHKEWNLEKCLERKESETKKITDYLFTSEK